MLQASRVFFIFAMLAAVVFTYSPLTNGAGITRLDNIRAAADQKATGPVSKIRNSENKKLPCRSRRPVRQTGLVPPSYPLKTR